MKMWLHSIMLHTLIDSVPNLCGFLLMYTNALVERGNA